MFHSAWKYRDKAKDVIYIVVETSLLLNDDDLPLTLVLEKCQPPAPHLKLALNHILVKLSKACPSSVLAEY
jgi:hypothetical protein